ncbi:transcription-repair coupling factor [Escherichia coli]|uniref:Transcription-repair coupling factor n=1 Tax=Escherichia coli TaxID=562 RepID=A0A376W5E1_ECOLX|nr:transcription-repair coupling factor [Escherichia coli]
MVSRWSIWSTASVVMPEWTTLEAGGITGEYLMLTYANDAKLYVPVSSLHLISRYAVAQKKTHHCINLVAMPGHAHGRKRREKVRDVAAELLDIYAQRAAKEGFAFKHDREQYQLFCDSFPFETTPDQAQAINAVLSDMCQPLAMDRLVCGDVGFGKTEVAMRAAFLAVDNHKQVRCWCLPPFSRSSITTTSATVSPTGRYVSK